MEERDVRFTKAEYLAYQARMMQNMPSATLGTTDSDLDDESKFHEEIIAYLKSLGVRGIIHSRTDQPTTQARGVPDLLFALDGVPVALEAKVKNRKPTPEQHGWLTALTLDGWITALVRSMADVQTALGRAKSRSV